MAFTCKGTLAGYTGEHQHETTEESKPCWGTAAATKTVTMPAPRPEPFRFGHRSRPNGPLSPAQYNLVGDLEAWGGDKVHAKTLTYEQCHVYINSLLAKKRGESVSASAPTAPPPEAKRDPRFDMIEALIPRLPDEAYFAVGSDPADINTLTFFRFSKPTKGKFAGAWKFQQHIGSGLGYRHELYAVKWPSDRWSFYPRWDATKAAEALNNIMLIVSDHQTASLLYAEHIGRCCRCNADLTDPRSRHYGIGPECEKYRPDIIELVDASEKGPYRG